MKLGEAKTEAENSGPDTAARQRWMKVLAQAPAEALEEAWNALAEKPRYTLLRTPETGTALVRAKAGGNGRKFNLGEMTVTRCAVKLDNGTTGFGYVAGRDKRKTELAATFDALMQTDSWRERLDTSLIAPAEAQLAAARAERGHKVASTQVDFFTMVRGDG